LSYFAASMFWRASVYPWNEDGSIPVPLGPFREPFRQYLMGLAHFPQHCVLWVAVREGKELDRLTHPPIGERREKYHVHILPMPGFGFSLTVSKYLPASYRRMCFVRATGNPIIVTELIEEALKKVAVERAEVIGAYRESSKQVGTRQ
jgi:hypothetical protein